MKFCQNCGFQMAANLTNCPKCGAVQQMGVSPAPVGQPAQFGQMGPMPVPYTQPTVDNRSKILWILLIVTIIGTIGSCFLPLIEVGGQSMNFVYYNGEVLDGVIVIGAEVIALICLLCKKKVPVFIFQLPACGILINDFPDFAKAVSNILAIGFYLVIIMVAASTILSLLRLILKDKFA